MDRQALWVSVIMQVFMLLLAIRTFLQGWEEEEMLKMVLSGVGGIVFLVLAILSVKRLRELY